MDPILQTIVAFGEAIMANPVSASFLTGLTRNVSGFLQSKYYEKTKAPYDPAVLGTTILKYEIATNALFAIVPLEYQSKIAPVVLVADIIFSAARKLKTPTS